MSSEDRSFVTFRSLCPFLWNEHNVLCFHLKGRISSTHTDILQYKELRWDPMWSRRQFKASITSCHILGSSCTIIRYFKNTRSILTSSYCVTLRVEALPRRVVVLIELLRFVGAMWTFRSRSLVKDQITKINIFSISCFLLRKISYFI